MKCLRRLTLEKFCLHRQTLHSCYTVSVYGYSIMADDTKKPLTPVEVRKRTGLTQARAASLLNVRPATVSDWENKNTVPHLTPSQWVLLMRASRCTPEELAEAFEPGAMASIPAMLQAYGLQSEGGV